MSELMPKIAVKSPSGNGTTAFRNVRMSGFGRCVTACRGSSRLPGHFFHANNPGGYERAGKRPVHAQRQAVPCPNQTAGAWGATINSFCYVVQITPACNLF
jgi:hypothetical protein